MATDEAMRSDLESDPSSLASQAAVELDNLLRGRGTRVSAVLRLAELITEEFSGAAHRATTVGVMKRAISESNFSPHPLTKVEDVRKEAEQVAESLKRIATEAASYGQEHSQETERMRSFCVAYSIQRSATDRPRNDKPQHPYRR